MILLLLASLIVLIVGYAWHNTQYWKRRGVKGPKSTLFVGNLNQLGDFTEKPMPLKLAEWTKKYGKMYGFQRGCRNALVLSDHKLAKEVFINQFENFYERDLNPLGGNPDKKAMSHVFDARGSRWKRLRTLTSLVFTNKSLKQIFPIVNDSSDKMCQYLEEDLKSNSVVNIAQNLKEFTADVIFKSAFGRDEDRHSMRKVVSGVMNAVNNFQGKLVPISWICPPIGPVLFILSQIFSFLTNNHFMFNFVKRIKKEISDRKEAKDKQLDDYKVENFIDLLIEAESNDVVLQYTKSYDKKNFHVEKKLTEHEILGTCIVILIAGFDTTANTPAFTFYHLAKNLKIQDKIRKETEEHCPDEDLDYDSLGRLKYLDAVIKETLRLHPIASGFTSRRCSNPTKIGNLEIEKGTDVILDVVSMHRNKEIWGKDADEYKPERWLDLNAQLGDNYGFGSGLRICVGMRFAQLEHKLVLAKILKKYCIVEVPETREAEQVVGALLRPKSVKVKLERI